MSDSRAEMPEATVLRTWEHAGLHCVLWQDDGQLIKGGVRRPGEALATVQVPTSAGRTEAERVVEGLAALLAQPEGPWRIDVEPITDVVMAPMPGQLRGDQVESLRRPFVLASDLQVLPIDTGTAEVIYRACDPPGVSKGFSIDLRGRPLYAIARLDAPREPATHRWDPDERLQLCLALSRLVRPTSISMRYAVRLIGVLGSGRYAIHPGPVRGFGAEAWTSAPERDWLALGDLQALRDLIAAWDARPFDRKSRLARSLWYHEYASRTRLVDLRWSLVSTAIETMITTGGNRSTQQFIHRLPLLAAAVGLPPISDKEVRRMWGLRSGIVHGEKHGGLKPTDLALYRRMEDTLRETLRHALTDPTFRKQLETKASVNAAFPLPAPRARTVTCPQCKIVVPVL